MHDPAQMPVPGARRAAVWRRYLRLLGPRVDADLDDELRFHIEMRVRDYVARGMSEADARIATANRLGDLAASRSACLTIDHRVHRRMTRAQLIDGFLQDVRFALRTLRRQPGWTIIAVLTLSLGIGANTAMFSVVDSLILHPLRYPGASRIRIINQEPTAGNASSMHVLITPDADVVRSWRARSHTFEQIEAYSTGDVTLRPDGASPQVIHAASILPSFLRFAGQRPALGRAFTEDDATNGPPVVALGETFWRLRLGSDPRVIGRRITIDDRPYTIVGVMPASLEPPAVDRVVTDVWLPLRLREGERGIRVVGRLRPGVTAESAEKELDSLSAHTQPVADRGDGVRFATRLMSPSDLVSFRDSLVMLSAAVALVLLIACTNVAHLLLARSAAREREMAIRAALGAGRQRLLRQLITESLVLAAAGCIGGILVGRGGLAVLLAVRPTEQFSEVAAARMNLTALLVTVSVSVLTGIVFGLVGSLQSSRRATHESLKAGALSTSQSRAHHRLRSLLVVSEMALSTMLLVGAALLIRSVITLQRRDPGFDTAGLYSLDLALPKRTYGEKGAARAFSIRVAEKVQAMPGVTGTSLVTSTPPSHNLLLGALQIEGDPPPARDVTSFIDYNGVEPGYFRFLGIRLVQGTTFTDTSAAASQVVVNEGLARRHWPGQSAIGRRLRVVWGGVGEWRTVVGVAADASTSGLTVEASTPMLYLPLGELRSVALMVRTAGESAGLPDLRAVVAMLDRSLPPPNVRRVRDTMAATIAGPRFTMMLLSAFTGLALLLAAVGLYGVMAYAVAQRTREIGIRVALGATRRHVANAVIVQGVGLALIGIAIGLLAAMWGTRLVESMLYGVARSDVTSFLIGGTVLIATALLACVVPTRRAVAIDPAIAMRAD